MTFTSTDPQSHQGKSDVWLTPLFIIEALGNNFDLDPCGINSHKTAREIWQLPKCGLKNEWFGKVWLNPPYSEARIWLEKMKRHRNGSVLLFARTGVFGEFMSDCDHIFLFRKRIRFLDKDQNPAKNNPGADSMILSYGKVNYNSLNGYQIK